MREDFFGGLFGERIPADFFSHACKIKHGEGALCCLVAFPVAIPEFKSCRDAATSSC